MIKKFTIIVLLMVLLKATLFGQSATATLTSVSTSPGQAFTVPLMVTNFSNISSITFIIKFDPAALTPMLNSQGKLNLTNLPAGYNLSHFIGFIYGGNKLVITFTDPNMFTVLNGKLFDINFTSFCGTTTTNLEFQGGCEVDHGIPPVILPVSYTNCQINSGTSIPVTELGNVTFNQFQTTVSVPVTFSGFSINVGSIEQHIQYDPNKLTFINATGSGVLSTGIIASANNGLISLVWINGTGGASINNSQINLNFEYTGNGIANLNFYPCCLFGNSTGTSYFDVNYINGSVNPAIPSSFATLGSLSNAVQGNDYEIPLILNSFQSGIPNGLGAYTLHLNFDNTKLSFLGVDSNTYSALVNQSGNLINIAWSNNNAININGQVLKLKFKYNGIGKANITFNSNCTFNSLQSNLINVGFTNSSISPIITTHIATIEGISGTVGTNVLVPIDFSGLPTNMGAVTLNISYDNTKLTFIDAQNNIHNATVLLNPTTHKINIAWNNAVSTNINGTFLNLRFVYVGGGNTIGTEVTFEDGCELADINTTIVPANWINGGVNLKFKISGTLTYNSDPNPEIPLVGYKVYLKSANGLIKLDSTITNINGYYEIMAAAGTYQLDAHQSQTAFWYADLDDVLALWDYTLGTNIPYQNNLRLFAADVTQMGIDLNSVLALWDRTLGNLDPEYTAPDFVFENPTITVNGANLVNQNFMGLCSGNILGSNPTP